MFFGCISLSRFGSVWTPRPKHSRKRLDFNLRFTISIVLGHALREGWRNRNDGQHQAWWMTNLPSPVLHRSLNGMNVE